MTSPKSLKQLLASWGAFVADTSHPQPPPYDGPDVMLTRLIEDSREVQPGDCFIARVRPYSDGHPYIKKAVAQGATLIVAQEKVKHNCEPAIVLRVEDTAIFETWLAAAWYDFPAKDLTVIGITGTDGKTSITNMLYAILVSAEIKTGMISTIKAVLGDVDEATGLHVTTPQAPQVQALLRRMVDAGLTHCILEVTSMGLAEHRADTAFFDIAVVSNITHEHLDYHGGYDQYLAAKGRLFELATQAAIINMDDTSAPHLLQRHPQNPIRYALSRPTDITASHVTFSAENTQFTLHMPASPATKITTALVGKFNVYNMLAAAGTAHALGIDAATVKAGLENIDTISGRMERISAGQSFLVIVDFAHTPNALAKAIEAARDMTKGRVIAVFGSAGRRDVEKRRLMAQVSAESADYTLLTAEDPREEPLEDILQMMAAGAVAGGGIENKTFWRVPDRGRAIYAALTIAGDDDLVLICGKGHEQSMCFGTTEYAWDDREATRQAITAYLTKQPLPKHTLPTFD